MILYRVRGQGDEGKGIIKYGVPGTRTFLRLDPSGKWSAFGILESALGAVAVTAGGTIVGIAIVGTAPAWAPWVGAGLVVAGTAWTWYSAITFWDAPTEYANEIGNGTWNPENRIDGNGMDYDDNMSLWGYGESYGN